MDGIPYRIVRSARCTTAIEIQPDGTVLVRCPRCASDSWVAELVASKEKWIRKKLALRPIPGERMTPEQVHTLAEQARRQIPDRVAFFADQMGVTYGRITIRNQRTRWGSCSSTGNLNFNCLLMLMPQQVIDYVVVHELSHRKHMNHSREFWATVKRYMPDYARHRQWLKENGGGLLARLP